MAAMYYGRAVKAEETASGKDNPRVAAQLSNLALALRRQGDAKAAEPLLRRALSIQERAFGRNHYQTATTLNNLGSVLQGLRQFTEAESLEREALSIFEQKRPLSLELAAVCANLADLLSARETAPRRWTCFAARLPSMKPPAEWNLWKQPPTW